MSIKKIKTNDSVKWEVRVRIYEDGQGAKRIRRWFDRKTEAEEFLLELKETEKKSKTNPFKDCSFENRIFKEEAEFWFKHNSLRFSPGHLARVKGILAEIASEFDNLKIEKITAERLSNFQISQHNLGKEKATINRKTEVICGILNFSAKHRRIPFNPASAFRKFESSSEEMDFWERSEAESFLDFASSKYPKDSENRWVYVAYLAALNTAIRGGELWGLIPIDLPQIGGRLFIKRQFNRVSLKLTQTKGKAARVVPCNKELEIELRSLIERRKISADETIFMNEERKPICHENFVKRKFLKDVREWGGRPIRFHDLRHTATTLMVADRIDIKTVNEICGHADIKTTMKYTHLVGSKMAAVANEFSIGRKSVEEDKKLSLIVNG